MVTIEDRDLIDPNGKPYGKEPSVAQDMRVVVLMVACHCV